MTEAQLDLTRAFEQEIETLRADIRSTCSAIEKNPDEAYKYEKRLSYLQGKVETAESWFHRVKDSYLQ